MLRSIMVPLDGSELAEQALPVAIALARRASAILRLVRVHEPPPLRPGTPRAAEIDEALRSGEARYLDELVRRIDLAGAAATPAVIDGDPAESIGRHALDERMDLIVMATHGRTGVSRAWLGSVADVVVRHAGVPVLLVRPGEQAVGLAAAPPFTRLLVPLDGSERAEAALEPAVRLATLFGAGLTLLRVVEPVVAIPPTYGYPAPATMLDQELFQSLVERADNYLVGTAARLRLEHPSLDVRTEVRPAEHVARGILARARPPEVDLVVMSTRGRGASRLFVGSVADKVLRGSVLPLLLVCTAGAEAASPASPVGEEGALAGRGATG